MHRSLLLACLVVLGSAGSVSAQYGVPYDPVLEMSMGFTLMSRGPGKGLERTLVAGGFRGDYNGQATHSGVDGFWKVDVRVGQHRSLGIMKTRVHNSTGGVRQAGRNHESLAANHTVVTRAVTWSYRPTGWLSVGAGPAIHHRRFTIRNGGSPTEIRSERSLGAVAGINVKFKRENGAFMHALWQYRYAGSLRSESITAKIPFSHRMLGLGVGLEF